MHYYQTDPFPGRCLNFRMNRATSENERCLDYDDTPHVCSFENKKPTISYGVRIASTRATPKPWVKPGDNV